MNKRREGPGGWAVEPWFINEATADLKFVEIRGRDYKRAVACVNGLATVKNPPAIAGLVAAVREWECGTNGCAHRFRGVITDAPTLCAIHQALAALDQEPEQSK